MRDEAALAELFNLDDHQLQMILARADQRRRDDHNINEDGEPVG